jgi:hypothetical protein
MEYLSNENKGMLWGILQESNIFNEIPDDKFQNIKQIFESTMREINVKMINNNLMEQNKVTVEELIYKINNDKKTYHSTNSSKLKVIYRAEDLHEERNNQLNKKLEEQRKDMATMINPKKPSEINFADSVDDDDKPIGDDMDRLISERLASRERELEIPSLTEEGEKWLNTTSTVVKETDKHVSFKNDISSDIVENKDNSLTNLLSKIKRKSELNENKSISIKEEIEYLIKKQDELISENIEVKKRLNIILNKI